VWLTALVLAATYATLTAGLRRVVRAPLAFVGGLVAAAVGSIHWLARPHVFTFLFLVLLLIALERHRRHGRWWALLVVPPLMLVWANTHGAFIAGLVLVALYGLGALLDGNRRRFLVLLGLLAVLAAVVMVHPSGPGLILNSLDYLGERWMVNLTMEYQSPDFHDVRMWPFAALLLGVLVLGWRGRRRRSWTAPMVMGVWAMFALYAARNVPLFALVAVWFLAIELDALLRESSFGISEELSRIALIERRTWGWPTALIAVLLGVGLTAGGVAVDPEGLGNELDAGSFPVAALDSLESALPEGPMFNEMLWGGYLLYRLWPERRVFFDGQTDFYGEELSREYVQVLSGGARWGEILEKYGVRWVLVRPTRALTKLLEASPTWERIYADPVAAMWIRSEIRQ
jgi:hypothetical protein